MKTTSAYRTAQECKLTHADLQSQIDTLDIRVNELEKVVNRLAHFCGMATESTTIDRDNWATNEMGERDE